ncbi:MAG: 4Fe-4S cluster-binding domain-containing protein [Lachnospiraceae bacterium]|nr:4Fe-4S cluster-binding domain-containing protein [Lachnospiraceae bacterium]
MSYFQKGFNYSQDGRGNRLVYHLQGCNMRCPWCANPEGLDVNGVLMTDPQWLTEGSCSKGAVREGEIHREWLGIGTKQIKKTLEASWICPRISRRISSEGWIPAPRPLHSDRSTA